MSLEHDLKHALRRELPEPGLAGRVLQRVAEAERPKRSQWWRTAAASVTLAAVLGGYTTYRVAEHRRGELAKEQLLTAMRIAGEKVRYAQQEVRAIGTNE